MYATLVLHITDSYYPKLEVAEYYTDYGFSVQLDWEALLRLRICEYMLSGDYAFTLILFYSHCLLFTDISTFILGYVVSFSRICDAVDKPSVDTGV